MAGSPRVLARMAVGRVATAHVSAGEANPEQPPGPAFLAGTKWVLALSEPDHKYSALFAEVRDKVAGACEYCSQAYGVRAEVEATGVDLPGDYERHPSLHRYVREGYQVITF
jgi:hypothetical protein